MQRESKIKSHLQACMEQVEKWKQDSLTIVFTNGCFDLIHPGHISYLRSAKALGDKLVLGINTDNSVSKLKGVGRPILKLEDRLAVLEALEMIDLLISFDEDTPIKLIEKIKPHFLVKGGDYKIEEIVGANEVRSYGGKVLSLNLVQGVSTTRIIDHIVKNFGND